MTTQTTNTATIKQPMNLEDVMKLLRTTDECLRYFDENDSNNDFYIVRDKVTRMVKKGGRRVKETVENWVAFNKYGEQHNINIAILGNTNWYLMDFDEDGNPIWDEPVPTNNTEETATA